jgi:hypothetical protein
MAWIAAALGRRILILLKSPFAEATRLERAVIASAIGLGALQYVPFFLGAVGLLKPLAIWIALGLLTALLFSDMLGVARAGWKALSKPGLGSLPVWSRCLLGILAICLVVSALHAMTPPADIDGTGYHLTLPKRWIGYGRLTYVPTVMQTTSPFGVEMLFTIPLAIWSETAAKLMHWLLGAVALSAIIALGGRVRNAGVGILAAAIFVIGLQKYSSFAQFGWAYIELGITAQLIAAMLAWAIWRENRKSMGWLWAAALCAGFCASYKIPGLPLGPLIGILAGWELWKQNATKAYTVRVAATVGALSVAMAAPWLIRSWALTGNPFWPMFDRLFPTFDWDPQLTKPYNEWMKYYIWAADRMTGASMADRQRIVRMGQLATLGSALLVAWRWRNPHVRAFLWVATPLIIALMAGAGLYMRYFQPLFPLYLLIVAFAVGQYIDRWKVAQVATVGVLLFFTWRVVPNVLPKPMLALQLATGRADRGAYLDTALPGWRIWKRLDDVAQPGAPVLTFGAVAPFYSNHPTFAADPLRQSRIRLDEFDAFVASIKKEGIKHLVMANADTPQPKYALPDFTWLDNAQPFVVRLAKEHGRLIAQESGQQLYQLDL